MISFGTWSTSTRPVSGTPPPMLYHWRIAFWKSASTAYSASKPGFCALILVNTGVKSALPFWKKSTVASLRLRFFSAFSSPVDPARPKSVSSPRKAMLLALPSLSSQPISASSMLASVGFTLKVHLLPPTPERSAIDVAEALATTSGTPARSTSGMMASTTELHSPSRMATYFFSASIWVTLFTASAGLQRLSWKSISSLRPSTPPLALASAMASSEPQRECWPKVATPPVSGIDEPIMMGPSWARANTENANAATAATAIVTRTLRMPIPLCFSPLCSRACSSSPRLPGRLGVYSTPIDGESGSGARLTLSARRQYCEAPAATPAYSSPARKIDEDQRLPPDAAPGASPGFREALPVRVGDAALVGAGRPRPRGAVLQLDARRAALRGPRRLRRRVHQRASPERLRLHAQPQPDGQRARQGDQRSARGHRADGRHAAHSEPAHPRGGRVRHARLHQRRPAGGGSAARQSHGRQPLLRHHAHGASRALPRGLRPHPEGLAGARDLRVEWPLLPARQREPLAPPHPAAASAGVGAGLGQHQHLRFRRRERGVLLLPELFGRPLGQGHDGRLLGRGRQERPRRQPVPRGLPAAGGRGGHRRARRGAVRAARGVLLSQVPSRSPRVVFAARQSGLPESRGRRAQPHALRGEYQRAPLSRLRRERLCH